MDNRYEIAEQNGMSREFADWFFDNKKAGCGNVWFMMMAAMWEGWQGRAAMLQGAEPVTTACKLRDDFDFGHFNDVTWLECVASNPQMHSPTTSTIAMVALELNRKLADGNSPVIPDGWVACSERMPETMVSVLVTGTWFHHAVAFWDGLCWCDLDFEQPVTHWMPLPAVPQQEVE